MKKSSKRTTGVEQVAAAHKVMSDLLAFTLHTLENLNQTATAEVSQGDSSTMDAAIRRKLHTLALAVAHDLSGHLTERKCWVPQTYGWASHVAAMQALRDHSPACSF